MRTDWDQIPIVIESKVEPNRKNPHAASLPQERSERLVALVRRAMLRRAQRIAKN